MPVITVTEERERGGSGRSSNTLGRKGERRGGREKERICDSEKKIQFLCVW